MTRLALIGFGEAANAFVPTLAANAEVRAFDIKTESADAASFWSAYRAAGVTGCASVGDALDGAEAVLSLVTADQAPIAAGEAAPHLAPDALFFDMNSVAPDTKRAAARGIERAGGRYVDVAVMAPVHPGRAATPLLLAGPHAAAGAARLEALGFTAVRVLDGEVGRASAIKMIRSVMVKGTEALTAECVLAAARAGVLDEVLASLDASPPPPAWAARADYNLDRMLVHGLRRAAEMEEVVKTLDGLGAGAGLARATVAWQRALGELRVGARAGLPAKINAVEHRHEDAA